MDEKKFEEMMDEWVERELDAAPKLQPTAEMLATVKAKKQPLFFPIFARWATVGVAAAAAMLIATIMYPRWHQPKHAFQEETQSVSPVERPVAAPPNTQNETASARSAVTEGEKMATDADMTDKGLTPPDVAPPAPAPELAEKPMAAERREMSDDLEEAAEKKADAPMMMVRGKDEAVVQSSPQEADSSTPALEVFIAPEKEQAAKPKICAVQPPVASSVPPGSEAILTGKIAEETSTSSFEQKASKLMSTAQPEVVAQCQRVGEKTFMLEHDVWVDSEHTAEKTTIAIQRDSEAYHQALELRPELKPYFDALPRVIVNLGEVSLEVNPQGKTVLGEEDVAQLKK